jgi:iron complex transport system substrate-binding protein
MRVVSLLPSATEIVYALGVEPVGVSHECDHPPAARELPAVERSRVDADAASDEIDDQVNEAEASGGVYEIRRDRLAALDPDLIVTQGLCDVCAVDRVVVREAVADLGLDADLLTVDVHTLEDLFDSIGEIGAALGREERADELVGDLGERVGAVERATADVEERPRTAVLDWTDPVMVAGHWIPETVATAGGEYGMAETATHSRPREWEELRDYDPEVLIVSPCGFDVDQTRENLDDLLERPGWSDLTAVREGQVYLVDGSAFVNRPGPRLVDTLEYLAWTLHPDRFDRPPGDAVQRLAIADA